MDILSALKIIHKNGVIHCDIKPQNMLVFSPENNADQKDLNNSCNDSYDSPQILRITDFGLSHIIPAKSTKAYMKYRCGTHVYTAPEITHVILII